MVAAGELRAAGELLAVFGEEAERCLPGLARLALGCPGGRFRGPEGLRAWVLEASEGPSWRGVAEPWLERLSRVRFEAVSGWLGGLEEPAEGVEALAEARLRRPGFAEARARSGSFYTPPWLVELLWDAMDAPLSGWVFEPGCGSGRFLREGLARRIRGGCAAEEALGELWGVEADAVAADLARLQLQACASGVGWEAVCEVVRVGDALGEEARAPRARVVVMNPPYLPSYSRRSWGPAPAEPVGGWRFGSRRMPGRANSYLRFLARGLSWLEPGGQLAAVVPDGFFINESLRPLREALLEMGSLERSWVFREPVFAGATVGTGAFVWRAGAEGVSEGVREGVTELIEVLEHGDEGLRRARSWRMGAEELRAHPKLRFDARRAAALSGEGFVALGERAEVRDGVNPGPRAVRARLLADEPVGSAPRRVVEGRDIQPFRLEWGGRWIATDGEVLSVEARRRGASLRRPEVFLAPRIVTRQTASRPVAAIAREPFYSLNSVHNTRLLEGGVVVLEALCAWLNSERCAAEWRELSGEVRRAFPQVHIRSLRALRVPARLWDDEDPVVREMAGYCRRREGGGEDGGGEELEALCARLVGGGR